MRVVKETARGLGRELSKPTEAAPRPERLGVGGAVIAGLAAKEGIIPQDQLGAYILSRLVASSNIDYDIRILPQGVKDKLAENGSDLNARAEDVARLALAQNGGKKPGRLTRIALVGIQVAEQYVEASKTAVANRIARIFNGDLTPEKYLSKEALQAISIAANKQEALQKELAGKQFQRIAERATRDIWKEVQGLIVAREMLSDEDLTENEKAIAKAIAVQTIREKIHNLLEFNTLAAHTVEANNIRFISQLFKDYYEKARKAELGEEIKKELNPNDKNYVSVIRVKPTQLFWNSMLDDEQLLEETIKPAFITGESGKKGVEIKMDIHNGNIVVVKGGSSNDTEVFPAQHTAIFWRQYDLQSIFSDSAIFKKVRKLLLYQGQNIEVGQIILYNQQSKKATAVPIITRMPEYDSSLEDKPVEGGGVALSLGLHVLKEAFSFAEEAQEYVGNGENNQVGRVAYAQALTKEEFLANHLRIKPIKEASEELVNKLGREMVSNQTEKEILIKSIKDLTKKKELYEKLSNFFRDWLKKNNLMERWQNTSQRGREALANRFCIEFGIDLKDKRKEIADFIRKNAERWENTTSAIRAIEKGEEALLETASYEDLCQ